MTVDGRSGAPWTVPPTERGDSASVSGDHPPVRSSTPRRARGQHLAVVERVAPCRRPPGRSRGPCRPPAPCRPGSEPTARRDRRRRGRRPRALGAALRPRRAPAEHLAARIAAGSSVRGLSSVTTSTSASARRDLAHHRPLAAVAVPAGADDDDQPSRRDAGAAPRARPRPRRACGRSRRRASEGLPAVDPLEPAGHARATRHAAATGGGVEAGLASEREGAQRVGDVEPPGERRPPRARSHRRALEHVNARPGGLAAPTSTARQSASRPAARTCAPGSSASLEQPAADSSSTLTTPSRARSGVNSARLGGEVVLDVGVEVEVVAAEVGEGRDVEDDAVDPAEHERVAGHLHRAGVAPRARA